MAAPRKPARTYSEEEAKAALELGAALGRRAAIRQLGISSATFQKWTEQYPELWSDLRANDPKAQRHGFARRLEDLAESYTAVEFEALERAEKLIKGADAKEAAALIKALGSARMAATTGSRQVAGDPVEHDHNINFPQLEAAIERLLEKAGAPPELPPVQVPNLSENQHGD